MSCKAPLADNNCAVVVTDMKVTFLQNALFSNTQGGLGVKKFVGLTSDPWGVSRGGPPG